MEKSALAIKQCKIQLPKNDKLQVRLKHKNCCTLYKRHRLMYLNISTAYFEPKKLEKYSYLIPKKSKTYQKLATALIFTIISFDCLVFEMIKNTY